ncbi:hypothetical protein C3V44_01350 [Capnocytophaga sp. oral taxon 864]|nr:hypothetical protein C3V44_01350 [Capnocytophaga sp. oral taxon 864]
MKSTNNILLIYILVLTYPHFSSVFCSFFVRLLFVFCSLFHYLLLWFTPFFVRSHFFLSHFSVTTLPLLWRGLGRGYFLRLFSICPSCYDCLSSYELTLYLQQLVLLAL